MGHVKGYFGHWQLAIGNWAFGHTELAEMICFSYHHAKAAQCAIPNVQSNLH